MMEQQNITLKEKVERYEKELELVNWYIQVLEDGIDTKEIAQHFYGLKKEHKLLKEKTEKNIARLTKQKNKLEKSNIEILA